MDKQEYVYVKNEVVYGVIVISLPNVCKGIFID